MLDKHDFYIDGRWQRPAAPRSFDVINPADEAVCGHISLGTAEDVDRAVDAATRAFADWSATSREEHDGSWPLSPAAKSDWHFSRRSRMSSCAAWTSWPASSRWRWARP